MKYTDDQIIGRVQTHAKGFEEWKPGIYDVWIRSKADVMDAFDDKVYTFEVGIDGVPQFRMVCTGTSNAGSYGLKKFKEYNPAGCAVLEADRMVYGSHNLGLHKGYKAYKQVKGFPYYRDSDMDDKAEEIGPVHNDVIAANCHRAAPKGVSTRIYNWSVACMVRNNSEQWFGWLAYMNGRPLNLVILNEF